MLARAMGRMLAAGTLFVVACSGCRGTHAPKAGRPDPMPLEDYPQITVLENLHRVVSISDVQEQPGPPLRVSVAARNRSDDERHVQYRFFFLDDTGQPESPNPDWHYVDMPGRTLVYLNGNALDRATGWRLEIRPAR